MTREEAIETVRRAFDAWESEYDVGDDWSKKHEARDMAIKALEQEPSYNSVNSLAESKLKNPKAKTFDILHFIADNAGLSTFEAIEKAYNMGVSEQEQVLNKIRAEIQNLRNCSCSCSDGIIDDVEDIIDKYKAESEDEK